MSLSGLHMEYKYLLELLKSGLYQQYIGDLYKAAIPFQDEERYGRSILENSSFLASSANPDESIHGRGFVARLSGSTVEFMDMWQRMMFGHTPFREEDDKLVFALQPVIPFLSAGSGEKSRSSISWKSTYCLPCGCRRRRLYTGKL